MKGIPAGYKQTEVGVIPEDWEVAALGRFWSVTDCKHVTARFVANGFPIASIKEVQSRFVDLTNSKQTTHLFYMLLIEGGRKPKSGDLILSRNATVGEVAQVAEWHPPFAMGQDVCLLRKKTPEFSTDYLQAIFRSHIIANQLADLMVGSTFKRANIEQIRNFIVPMPLAAEQEAIAEALSDTDGLIESLEQLIAKKRHLKQGAMQELLTGKKHLPGFGIDDDAAIVGATGRSPLPNVPHGWEVKRLGKLATITRGASPRPIDSPIWFDENSTIGWVRISDVTKSGMFLSETTQRLSPLGVKNSRPVGRGSLIMSICATIGRPVITEIDTCIHDGFVVFDAPCVNQLFLYYALKFIEGDWGKHGQTGSQMNLNTGLINRTKIAVPKDEAEQTAIAAILSDMDAEIAALETKLTKTRQLKQGMMHNLLTGKIRLFGKSMPAIERTSSQGQHHENTR